MAVSRATPELSRILKNLEKILLPSFRKEIQTHLDKQQGYLFLSPLKLRLLRGISGDGSSLAPYSDQTKLLRKKKGLRQSPTTLRYTGDWYKSMFVKFGTYGKRHIIEVKNRPGPPSEDGGKTIQQKTDYLTRKYGSNILKMTKDEEELIILEVEKYIVEATGDLSFSMTL